jgi:hypothetical protein
LKMKLNYYLKTIPLFANDAIRQRRRAKHNRSITES